MSLYSLFGFNDDFEYEIVVVIYGFVCEFKCFFGIVEVFEVVGDYFV